MTINLDQIARGLTEPWQPQVVAKANGFQMKAVRLHGEFPWHQHDKEDELFFCLEGSFRIEFDGEPHVTLRKSDVFVVQAGVRHRPVADQPALALLFERAETRQYGD